MSSQSEQQKAEQRAHAAAGEAPAVNSAVERWHQTRNAKREAARAKVEAAVAEEEASAEDEAEVEKETGEVGARERLEARDQPLESRGDHSRTQGAVDEQEVRPARGVVPPVHRWRRSHPRP